MITNTDRGSGRSYRALVRLLQLTAAGRRCFFITQDPWTSVEFMARQIAADQGITRLQVHGVSHCFQITSGVTMVVRPDRVLNEMEQSVRGRLDSLYVVDHYVVDANLLGPLAWDVLQAFPKRVLERIDA